MCLVVFSLQCLQKSRYKSGRLLHSVGLIVRLPIGGSSVLPINVRPTLTVMPRYIRPSGLPSLCDHASFGLALVRSRTQCPVAQRRSFGAFVQDNTSALSAERGNLFRSDTARDCVHYINSLFRVDSYLWLR